MKKLLVLTLMLALVALAASNVFKVTFEAPAWVGPTEIKAGDYKLEIEGDKVLLITGKKEIPLPARVEVAPVDYKRTLVVTMPLGSKAQLKQIEIAKTRHRVVIEGVTIPTGE